MSRSRRKTPIIGITCRGVNRGEKDDKRRWHRAWRRASRMASDAGEFLSHRLFSDPWAMAKDGKQYLFGSGVSRWLRK